MKKYLILSFFLLLFFVFIGVMYAFAEEWVAEIETLNEEIKVDPFIDVKEGDYGYVAIGYLYDQGILKGYPDGTFRPDNPINRIEALKVVMEATDSIEEAYIANNSLGSGAANLLQEGVVSFSDVYKSQWFYPYIKKAVEDGIVNGYPDGSFRPLNTVNLAETLKISMIADSVELSEAGTELYSDVSVNAWYAPYFQEAKNREILFHGTSLRVYPSMELDRDHFAEVVYRYLRSNEGVKFGQASYYADYFAGRGTSSGEPYDPNAFTAAHKTLPFGTWLKVTNLENGKSVNVKVNDRGPFITGRVIDLSRVAFEQIGHTGSGVIRVEYEIIDQPL